MWNTASKPQAVFRIYQGPPGCGKTSLAYHLAETRAKNTLFVRCDPEDLIDSSSLLKRIGAAVFEPDAEVLAIYSAKGGSIRFPGNT